MMGTISRVRGFPDRSQREHYCSDPSHGLGLFLDSTIRNNDPWMHLLKMIESEEAEERVEESYTGRMMEKERHPGSGGFLIDGKAGEH